MLIPLFVLIALASTAEADWRYSNLDLDVWIDPEARTIRIEGNGQLLATGPSSRTIDMRLGDETGVFTLLTLEAGVSSGESPGVKIPPIATGARVSLPAQPREGEEIGIRFTAEAVTDSIFRGEVVFVPWSSGWYPVPFAGDGRPEFRIAGRTTFHLPPGWLAVTNGEHLETSHTESAAIDAWHISEPAERSFCAGPYELHRYLIENRPFSVYLLSDHPDRGEPQARALARTLTVLETRFGPCPYPAPSLAEFPQRQESWHATANYGFILAETSAFVSAGANLPLVAHELGHAWWGNIVRAEGKGALVCSESMAQYAAALAIEDLYDERTAAEFLRFSSGGLTPYFCARGYFAMVLQGLDKPLLELGSSSDDYTLAYAKGPWIYRMLRHRVGDERFFAVLREVIEEHEEGGLTLDGLRKRYVDAAPEAELEGFFSQWLDRMGAPVLEMQWEQASAQDGAFGVSVVIKQVQEGAPFSLWLDLGVLSSAGVSTHRVQVSESVTKVSLAVEGSVEMLVLDPKHKLLIWDPDYGVRPKSSNREK